MKEAMRPLRYPTACVSYNFFLYMIKIKSVLSKHIFSAASEYFKVGWRRNTTKWVDSSAWRCETGPHRGQCREFIAYATV